MKSMRLVYALAAAAVLAGCGGGNAVCDKANEVAPSLNSKMQPCGESVTIDTGDQCKKALESCSSSDQALLNTFLDCANGLPICTATDFGTKRSACESPLSNLSSACKTATAF